MKTKFLQCLLLLLAIPCYSQRDFNIKEIPFKSLTQLDKKADKLWDSGEYSQAEKLYYQAYKSKADYMNPLIILARNKFKIGDIKGANAVYDSVINHKYNNRQVGKLLTAGFTYNSQAWTQWTELMYYEKLDKNFKGGDTKEAIATSIRWINSWGEKVNHKESGSLLYVTYNASVAAFAIGDKESLIKLNSLFSNIKNGESGKFYSFIYLCFLNKEYETALNKLLEVAANGSDFMGSKMIAKSLLPYAYAYMGENDKALAAIKESASSMFIAESDFDELYAIIALNQKNYALAIQKTTAKLMGVKQKEPKNKFKLYAIRAEAYVGLGDLIVAKKDFEAALAFNADYAPALEGLAKLEGKIITDRQTDKIPPEIVITEPANTRGIKVLSIADDVMVKGTAIDASGLRLVTINGIKVYSKETGDFWGNVNLAEGQNKILIVATDMSGNKTEKTFEIEKNITSKANEIIPVAKKEGKNYTLLIASQNYSDISIPSLEEPIPDAVRLKLVLKNVYNFTDENIITLFNPERSELRQKFLLLNEILQPEDNLIIFYAGHGIWVDKEKKGYWLLTDAKRNDVNTWVSNKEVLEMIAAVPSRHTLLITDACFSGSVFKTRSIGADAPVAIKEMEEKISRVAITSGNDTEVPDESVFMKYLVKALTENKEKYLTAQKMFINQIMEAVMTETKTEPRYGTLELAGHVGGDFIFAKK
jgi:tetratricopeptide (TPR) repeat protein